MSKHWGTIVSRKLKRNISLIYGLSFFQCFMLIVPVIVPFFASKGLSLAEIFYLQAVFATTIVLLEAPSGYFADLFGRRNALMVGSVLHGLGYLVLNFADNIWGLMAFEIVLGIAASLLSGADLALLYDTRKALEGETGSEHSKAISHLSFTKNAAEALGALLGGTLAIYSFDLLIQVQSVAAWLCLLFASFVYEPPYQQADAAPHRIKIIEVLRHLFMQDPLLRKIVIAIPIYSLATFNVAWLIQPYWEERGMSLAMFGVLWCAQGFTTAITTRIGFGIERRLGAAMTLSLIGILPVVGHLGMAFAPGQAGIVIALLLFAGRGLNQVILVNALNRRVPSEFRAAANSFISFLFRLIFILTGPVIDYVAQLQRLGMALNVIGASYIAVFVMVMIPLIQWVKNIQQRVAA